MFNMFFYCLFSNFQGIRYFLVSPTLGKIFHDRLLSVGKLEPFLGLIRIELLAAAKLFQCHN